MIIAQEKRKKNIGEYILYMWQIEDLIRALKFDMESIGSKLVTQYQADEQKTTEIRNWYQNLTLMLQKEQKTASGHLQFLVNLTDDLNRFHLALVNQRINDDYNRLYEDIADDIESIRAKSNPDHHDIDVVLNTLYIILMLKMKKQEVSEGTQMAIWKFGNFMGQLSNLFRLHESGELELEY